MVKVVGKYELGRTLGEGTFGKVKYAVNTETNGAVAIKVLDKEKIQKQNMGNQIKREISIMKLVKHKYIVEMIEVLASKSKIFIVLELVTGGELFDKIVRDGRFSEQQALFYFGQLLEGVEYCHGLGVCHRDLKPENLLLDEHGNLKISDFGLSSLYVSGTTDSVASRTQLLHTTCGTPNYVAPEVLADQGYDGKKADVWSMGVILYVLLAGFLPFDEKTIVELFQKIQNAEYTFPSWFTNDSKEIIGLILVADPKKRISSSELKRHPHLCYLFPQPDAAAGNASGATNGTSNSTASAETTALAKNLEQLTLQAQSNNTSEGHDVEEIESSKRWSDNMSNIDHDFTLLKKLNAFDLVNQCGGFGMDEIFNPSLYYGVPPAPAQEGGSTGKVPPLATAGVQLATDIQPSPRLAVDGNIAFGARASFYHQGKSGTYNFTSPIVPAQALIESLYGIFKSTGWEISLSVEESKIAGVIRATRMSPKGMIGIGVNVFILCSNLSFLQIIRGKGDRLEWNAVYQDLIDSKIAHLINRAADGEAKASSQRLP